jgi:hypothetical protein
MTTTLVVAALGVVVVVGIALTVTVNFDDFTYGTK